jgi:hypothetical protein
MSMSRLAISARLGSTRSIAPNERSISASCSFSASSEATLRCLRSNSSLSPTSCCCSPASSSSSGVTKYQ